MRALALITVLPRVTWPSPAITTWLPLRTESTVVPRQPLFSASAMPCQMGQFGARVKRFLGRGRADQELGLPLAAARASCYKGA